jgi:hypothetical protein
MPERCPGCNRFGKSDLGGYCTPCHEKKEPEKKRRKQWFYRDLHKADFNVNRGGFFRDHYGIVKDKFGIQKGG